MPDQYVVIVKLHDGTEVQSPRYTDEAQAQGDHDKIAGAMESGEFIKLPWLSVVGGQILITRVEGRTLPRGG